MRLQFHLHTPSEHTIQGKQMPLEVHIVHLAAGGDLECDGSLLEHCISVVGIMYTVEDFEGAEDDVELTRLM